MACKMTDKHFATIERFANDKGYMAARYVGESDGSLASAREAAIAAFTKGYMTNRLQS